VGGWDEGVVGGENAGGDEGCFRREYWRRAWVVQEVVLHCEGRGWGWVIWVVRVMRFLRR
jgi:hypothetical protein